MADAANDNETDPVLKGAFQALRDTIDGKAIMLTAPEASALHAVVWDLRAEIGRLKARLRVADIEVEQLHAENDKIVAQLISEEQRAMKAELMAWEGVDVMREVLREPHERTGDSDTALSRRKDDAKIIRRFFEKHGAKE